MEESQVIDVNSNPVAAVTPLTQAELSYGLTDKIPIFNYLVTTERVGWYRTIMRFFLSRHREFYKYQLTAHEIWEAVRQQFDPAYTLDKCQNDLRSLEDWGNLITTYDASRHTSIQSFRSPALLYQATPLAISVEIFLEQQRRVGSSLGALRQGDLAHLWEMLERLDSWLAKLEPGAGLPARSLELAEEWRRAFDLFGTMAREAAQYLANMIAVARRPRPSLESYQSYKRSVVEYVTNFGQTLTHYSVSFRELLSGWYKNGRATILIEAIAAHLQPPSLEEERRQTPAQLAREAANQVGALSGWFAIGSNADTFRRAAAAEVEKVVRRAEQFAAAARPNANYATDLDVLARRLLEAVDPEETRQLLLVAFAHGLPGHLPENLAGPNSTTGAQGAWQELPSVTPILRSLGRSVRIDKTVELAISDNRAAQYALIQRRLFERAEERERFATLFATGSLNVGEVWVNSPAERAALLAVVRGCLRDSRFEYHAPDGSLIIMLNPKETRYGLLRAPDGSLLMPRYQLKRVVNK
ncbi:MAG: TIGR02677 family protein [Chloroflexi bacterium]|nr:TIGR02677 family protein [Chloroflexota bacterium]